MPTIYTEATETLMDHAKAAEAPTVHGTETIEEALWQTLKGVGADGMIRRNVVTALTKNGFEKSESFVSDEAAKQSKNDEGNIPSAMEDNIPPAHPPQSDITQIKETLNEITESLRQVQEAIFIRNPKSQG
ncbi:hypothetical protein PVK06_032956 [Gossypium arboreum]|uniref:Uncharacterized protein n=1 Tax=Gossypium arboreum TaxID=29729 RepID=A0ABR0NVG0_GOSAR|nr:hypothetical protein PVK06_032956 [Gossypium arboreum]